jgi:D-glycero-alpha-D-manno-heptose-7-phosphate kinase
MIISRTPFRLTLGGGGTDLPSFYEEFGGFVLAAGIDKFMYLNINTPILDDFIRVRYNKAELVHHVDEVEHTLAREALRKFDITNRIEIVSIADIPAGTGLGSSSCYLVGLLQALHALADRPVSPEILAAEACYIELEILGKPIGKQDQYMAAFGGLTVLEIERDGSVRAKRLLVNHDIVEKLENDILLFYTGTNRDALAILGSQNSATKAKDSKVVKSLLEIKGIGIEVADSIQKGNLRRFGELLDLHWMSKKRLSGNITNERIDQLYELAKRNGAIGGKISGAGGGGFLMLYCEGPKQLLRDAMRGAGLRELKFRFEFEGSKVVFDIVSRDERLAFMNRRKSLPVETGKVTAEVP